MTASPQKDNPLFQSMKAAKQNDLADLKKAFIQFSQETDRLEKSYQKLQEKFLDLQRSLDEKVLELGKTDFFLNNLLTHISQGFLFINREGTIAACNKSFEILFKLSSEKILQNPFESCFPDNFFGFSLLKALKKKEAPEITFFSLDTVDGLRDFEVTLSFIDSHEHSQDAQGIFLLIREITHLKELEKTLQRNNRLKELGEMAASLAHEIRNPLGGIEGFATLLKYDLQKDEKKAEMAEQIIKGVKRLNRLVTSILDYAKPLTLHFHPIDLTLLTKEVIESLSFEKKNSVYHFKFLSQDASAQTILGDADLIRSALLNLLLNAMQSMPKGGEIFLEIKETATTLSLKIQDHGAGIKQNYLEKLFQPFFTTKEQGTGLGLSEAHKIVQSHGGTIDVTSVMGPKKDQGTTFILTFPRRHS